jgi:hypothetical protein
MEQVIEINIANEFGKTLGARYKYEGKFSGELFLETLLLPKFNEAIETNRKVKVYLDGVLGYPSSFVSGSFGKLSLDYTASKVLNYLILVSSNSIRKDKIIAEITNPKKKAPTNT